MSTRVTYRPKFRAADVVELWRVVSVVFRARNSRPSEWLKLLEVVAACEHGVLFKDLKGGGADTVNLRTVRRWEIAGLVTTCKDLMRERKSGRAPLRIYATPKAAEFCRVLPVRCRGYQYRNLWLEREKEAA